MTYILKIGDRRRLKAGIRVLHHTGHRAPCSGGRLNFAEARRATSAQPSPSEEDTPSSKNGKAKETVHPCCKYRRKGKSVRELLRQPHTPLSSGGRLRLRCPLRQGRPRRRVALDASPNSWARSSGCGPAGHQPPLMSSAAATLPSQLHGALSRH